MEWCKLLVVAGQNMAAYYPEGEHSLHTKVPVTADDSVLLTFPLLIEEPRTQSALVLQETELVLVQLRDKI